MSDSSGERRRQVLKGVGTLAGLVGIAGCGGGDSSAPTTDEQLTPLPSTTMANTTATASGPTLEIDRREVAVEWSRDLADVTEIPASQTITGRVEPATGSTLADLELRVTVDRPGDGGADETVYDDVVTLGTPEASRLRLPCAVFPRGTRSLFAVDTASGASTDRVELTLARPENFRIDFAASDAWETIYAFDDFDFSHERIWNKRMAWNAEQAYTDMIQTLNQSNLSEEEKDIYTTKWAGYFPGDIDVWDRGTYREHKKAKDVLMFAGSATQIHQVAVIGIKKRSGENDEFSATVERLINSVHPDEQDYKRKVTTTHVNQVGHGTCIAYAHTDDTDLKGDNNWWFLDTTAPRVRTLSDATIHDGYNPFVQSYHGQQIDSADDQGLTREKEKVIALGPLGNFVVRGIISVWSETLVGYALSDPLLEFVYNDHIRDRDGAIAPVLKLAEKIVDYQLEHGLPVTVIGSDWSTAEFVASWELYDAAMDMDIRLTKDRAYDIMARA